MSDHSAKRNWWKLVLTGVLAIAFGISAIVFPGRIIFERIVDVIFGVANPFSGSMTSVAALLALVALVAVDGLVNLFGTGVIDKRTARVRGVIGVATAIVTIFWPGKTAFFAVELLGLWAITVGVLELRAARYSTYDANNRALIVVAAIASILLGVTVMKWQFTGAVLISAVAGIAAMARGISLIMRGISERSHQVEVQPTVA